LIRSAGRPGTPLRPAADLTGLITARLPPRASRRRTHPRPPLFSREASP
jgi:hypothetical protein